MSTGVQITLIICATIIILSIISSVTTGYKSDNEIEYCKSPTYPRPQVPGANKKSTNILEFNEKDE